jgi:RNA polymerase sigma-70 factor, ECF subfamily
VGDPVTADTAAEASRLTPSDSALIEASLRDPARFAAVFDRHSDEIYRYAAGRLGPDAADDVTAETFLTAFRKRGTYDLGRSDARPWLYGIATNWIREHRRIERRHYEGLTRLPVPRHAEAFDEAVADRVTALQMVPRLAGALAALSRDERDLLLLVAWTDLSYGEVAQALGVAPGTVASRLHRVRAKMRKRLGGQDFSQP